MSDVNGAGDGELLRRYVVDGCQASFARVVARHAAMVRSVCRRVAAGAGVDPDDVAQVVFVTLAERAGFLTGLPSVGGWLHRTAWNAASRHRRDAATRGRHERAAAAARAAAGRGAGADAPSAAASLDRDVIRVEVHRAVNALPEPYHVAVVLHDLQGWSLREVAELVGSPVGTVAAHVSRGRRMVRDRLDRRGIQTASVAVVAALLAAERASEAAAGGTAASLPAPPSAGTSLAGATATGGGGTSAGAAVVATAALLTPAWSAAIARWAPPAPDPALSASPGGAAAGAALGLPSMAAFLAAARLAVAGVGQPAAVAAGFLFVGCLGFAGAVRYNARPATDFDAGVWQEARSAGAARQVAAGSQSGDSTKADDNKPNQPSSGSGGSSNVPEPGSATLIAAAGLGLLARRRRRTTSRP